MSDQRIPISQLSETQTAPDASYIAIDDGSLTKKITVENFNSTSTASAQQYANQAAASAQTVEDNIATSAAQIREATLAAREATQASTAATASATSAYDSASLAQNYSANASTSAGQAMNAADSSAQNLTASKGYAEDSEAWAVGKRNGTDVPASDETYQNNAKYYANSASGSAARAEAAAQSINVPDTTLTVSGVAADSKTTGDRISAADAELADIRIMTDGTTAATAGDAVREQFTELKNDLNVVSEGYSPLQYTTNENVYVGNNGVYVSNNIHRSTSHISVTPGELLYIYNPHVTYNNAWYDENDAYISKFRIDAGTPITLTVPANAKYMALSNTKQYFFTGLFRDGIGIENKESITAIEQSVGSVTDCIKTVNSGLVAFDIGMKANTRILRDNGSEVTDTGFYATDYIYIPKDALFLLETSTTLSWGALYDENKTYIEANGYGVGKTRLIFTDAGRYVRFSAPLDVMQGVLLKIYKPTDTTLTYAGMPADAKVVGDKISAIVQNNAVIPPYYESHLSSKESIIRGHFDNCAFDGDGLIFLTDTHFSSDLFTSATPTSFFNANNSFSLIADIIGKCAIDKIVFGGDLVNSTPDVDTMLLCMSSFGTRFGERQDRLRYCVGNHEYFTGNDLGQTIKPTPAMLYGASVKYNEDVVLGKGDMVTYYFDNALQKIRYFVVSCGRATETTTTQIAWLLNAFKEIPANYKVVVIGHGFIADDMTAFRGGYAPIAAALDAVKAKTDYVYNNVTYDYSTLSNVDVVCMITGHTHIDGSIITTGGIPCICTTTDSYDLNIELVNGTPTNVPRQKGTINEQAFDVFQFDFTNRKIYATRIGYGADREFSY